MTGFNFVLFYTMFAATSTFYFGRKLADNEERGYFKEIKNQYRIMMYADFIDEVDEFSDIEWMFFATFTFFITIVLMNLLIAIISDTYIKTMANV